MYVWVPVRGGAGEGVRGRCEKMWAQEERDRQQQSAAETRTDPHTYIYAYTRPALAHRVSRRGAQGQ